MTAEEINAKYKNDQSKLVSHYGGNASSSGGISTNQLVQNLWNYNNLTNAQKAAYQAAAVAADKYQNDGRARTEETTVSAPFDNQKNYTSNPVAMTTTATGTNYGVPIGPVPQGSSSAGGNSQNVGGGYSTKTGAYPSPAAALAASQKSGKTANTAATTPPTNTPSTSTPDTSDRPGGVKDTVSGWASSAVDWVKNNLGGSTTSGNGNPNGYVPTSMLREGADGNGNTAPGNTPNLTPPGAQPQSETPVPSGYVPDGSGSGGGYGSGGGGYGSAAAILGQLGGGTGLTTIGTGTGTGAGTPYVPITQGGAVSSPEAAAAYAQLLQQAGYDLNQPLTGVELPNRVDLPQEVALPENFDFQRAWDQAADVDIGRINHVDTHPEEEMLGQITDLQSRQAILNADNTVKNGIVELQRVMQDAQRQYQNQRDQISMDEQRALDNQVLYNEARGDRGGIGQEQYNTIQNTAATNRMTVQQEQTQLATDTARQIADLRSQGEFEKANQLLNISQKYLSELMDLYQWAKETNVGIDEFNLQVAQWEENFKLSLIGAELDADAFNLNVANAMIDQQNNLFNARFNQENSLFDARLNAAKLQNDEAAARLSAQLNAANATGAFANGTPTYAAQQDAIANQLKERQLLSDVGLALIKAGVQPSEAILNAMGMGGMASAGTGEAMAGTLSGVLGQLGFSDATSALRAMGIGNAGLAGIAAMGMTPEQYLANALGVSTSVAGLPALGTTTATTTVPTGAEQMLSQLEASPNYYSEVAAYSAPTVTTPTVTQPTGYTDANVYAAFGADPETVLRAMGVGNDGMAGLAYLGITPAQFIGQAFGL